MSKLRETFLTALTACKEQGSQVDLEDLFPDIYPENKAFFDELLSNMLQLLRDYSQVCSFGLSQCQRQHTVSNHAG